MIPAGDDNDVNLSDCSAAKSCLVYISTIILNDDDEMHLFISKIEFGWQLKGVSLKG